MSGPTLTLQLPEGLYTRLKQRADQAHRSVEAELLELLASAVPGAEELPADMREAIAALERLDDEALRRAAGERWAGTLAAELESVHLKRQREGLTESESQRCADLVQQYERGMLVRAQAAVLLQQRSHDVSGLVASP